MIPLTNLNTDSCSDTRILPFQRFILTEKKYLLIALTGAILQFIIFKILYPFPDFISDSYSYIETNLNHMQVNIWPIGYSKFLSLVHWLTSSHVALVSLQYLILVISLLYFFYAVLYLFEFSRRFRITLFCFLFFNPLFSYLSNCVLSDALFLAVSLVLFTQWLWMLRRPAFSNLVLQGILIGIAFSIRYTAIYYPFVSVVVILFASYRLPVKLAGIALPWMLIVPFILYTQEKTKEITGTAEFSVFGGWQIANNALYMREHIQVDSTVLPEGTQELDRMARAYFRKIPAEQRELASIEGTFFIKVPNAILKPYLEARYWDMDAVGYFRSWGKVSPVYKKYGSYLIKKYPLAFTRYYLLPNTQNYFVPYLEKFGSYNIGWNKVGDAATEWFKLNSNDVHHIPPGEFQGYIFFIYPIFFAMLNLYFAGGFLCFLFSGNWKRHERFTVMAVLATASFLLCNFGFSVFATPVVLRYQILPMILLFCFSLLLTEQIILKPNPAK